MPLKAITVLKNLCRKSLIRKKPDFQKKGLKFRVKDKEPSLEFKDCTHQLISLNIFRYILLRQRTMSLDLTSSDQLKPPKSVQGMINLDRSAFIQLVKVPTVTVPIECIKTLSKKLKPFYLKMPHMKQIVELESRDPRKNSHRLILLDPVSVKSYAQLDETLDHLLSNSGLTEDSFAEYEIKLTYENWSCSEILHAVTQENISGFALVGHICHFNLKDCVLPYKSIIGEVILDKLPTVKTVVNKINTIDNTFRSFQMELLAGDPNYITQVRENGIVFELDFSKVYWNSRLSTEHQRVVDCMSNGDIVYDVFAGVGPFAIPAVKRKKATVFANDLNPVSYEYLQKNVTLNKIKTGIQCFNMDGRDFIKSIVKIDLIEQWKSIDDSTKCCHSHIIMNLPALAIEFLDAFKGLTEVSDQPDTGKVTILPKVYCYCFTDHKHTEDYKRAEEGELEQEVKDRVMGILGNSVAKDLAVRYVRNVAPNKEMMCATFTLTWEVLAGQKATNKDNIGEPEAKHRRIDETVSAELAS